MHEVAHETIVDPEPSAVAKRVAVGLPDGCPRRGADVREEEGRLDVAGDLAQVEVVQDGLDAPEDGRSVGVCIVPAEAEAVAVGLDAEAGVSEGPYVPARRRFAPGRALLYVLAFTHAAFRGS